LQLREKHSIDWRKIAEIKFCIPSLLPRVISYPEPRTGIEAKFSLGHCMCRALIYGEIKIADFRDDRVADPSITQLMKKIKWEVIDQEPGELPFGFQEIAVKMIDGNVFTCRVRHPRGEPQNPLTVEDSNAKYEDCSSHAHYSTETANQIKELVLNLDEIKCISEITELFLL
jgi:2-methylcitrate dehydratase PrpD